MVDCIFINNGLSISEMYIISYGGGVFGFMVRIYLNNEAINSMKYMF